MIWEVQLAAPQRGRKKIRLEEKYYYNLQKGDMIGIYNPQLPGPIAEVYNRNSTVVLSLLQGKETNLIPPEVGTILEFDDLQMPYTIPVYLCSTADCEDCDNNSIGIKDGSGSGPGGNGGGTGTSGGTGGGTNEGSGGGTGGGTGGGSSGGRYVSSTSRDAVLGANVESIVHSTEFMIGMIAWNIVLTVLIFILMCVIMFIVNDNEKRNKREKRERRMRKNDAFSDSYSQIDTIEVEKSAAQSDFDTAKDDSTYEQPVPPPSSTE